MSPRTLGPTAGLPQDMLAPLGIMLALGVPVALAAAAWVAGRAASFITGHGWGGPGLSGEFAVRFVRDGPSALWPGVPPALVVFLLVAIVFVAVALMVLAWLRVTGGPAAGDALGSLATVHQVAGLAPAGIAARARQLRPSIAAVSAKDLPARECGLALGQLLPKGPILRASWEDVVLAVMAPRAGKTTALAVPAILDAPGAVIATSNKADLWTTSAGLRRGSTGDRVWTFDPQRIAHVKQTWWWNPLRGVTTVEDAHRLAGHFVQEIRNGRNERDFWSSAAHDLLTSLILAAASSRRGLSGVYEWLNDPVIPTPVELLRQHGYTAAAASLLGRQNGAPETRDGVYETARTAAQCLRDPEIMAWVSPPVERKLTELDAAAFVGSSQTLYLLSKDGAAAAAPLVAALTDRVLREATRAAERRGGRLDPPIVVVLDEAANVCRIADLPDLYSHLGSRGVLPVTILQSYRQGVRVWGEAGMGAMWSASTVKVIGAGIDDAKLAEDISRLIGDHDVTVRSISHSRHGTSESSSLRRQRILAPEDVRALPRGRALVLATGARAAMVRLLPWYEGDRRDEVALAARKATDELTSRARIRSEARA